MTSRTADDGTTGRATDGPADTVESEITLPATALELSASLANPGRVRWAGGNAT